VQIVVFVELFFWEGSLAWIGGEDSDTPCSRNLPCTGCRAHVDKNEPATNIIYTQKSPIYNQKSPIHTKKSLIYIENTGPTSTEMSLYKKPYIHLQEPYIHPKEPYIYSKRALNTLKRAHLKEAETSLCKRALCTLKRALYTPKRTIHTV